MSTVNNTSIDAIFWRRYLETLQLERQIGLSTLILYPCVALVGIISNSLVLMVIGFNPPMRNATNIFIGNLALADLLFLLFAAPLTGVEHFLPTWHAANCWCALARYLQFLFAYESAWTLVLLAGDRLLAVRWAIETRAYRTSRNALLAACCTWIIICSCCSPLLVVHKVHHYRFGTENRSSCGYQPHMSNTGTASEIRAYYLSFNVFGYLLPLILCAVLYYYVIKNLRNSRSLGYSRKAQERRKKARQKITRMLLGVLAIFALFCAPIHATFFWRAVRYPRTVTGLWFVVFSIGAQVLMYANSCLNPVLYAALSASYRKGFVHVFQCRPKRGFIATHASLYGTFRDITTALLESRPSSRKSPVGQSIRLVQTAPNSPKTSVKLERKVTAFGNLLNVSETQFSHQVRSNLSCPDFAKFHALQADRESPVNGLAIVLQGDGKSPTTGSTILVDVNMLPPRKLTETRVEFKLENEEDDSRCSRI